MGTSCGSAKYCASCVSASEQIHTRRINRRARVGDGPERKSFLRPRRRLGRTPFLNRTIRVGQFHLRVHDTAALFALVRELQISIAFTAYLEPNASDVVAHAADVLVQEIPRSSWSRRMGPLDPRENLFMRKEPTLSHQGVDKRAVNLDFERGGITLELDQGSVDVEIGFDGGLEPRGQRVVCSEHAGVSNDYVHTGNMIRCYANASTASYGVISARLKAWCLAQSWTVMAAIKAQLRVIMVSMRVIRMSTAEKNDASPVLFVHGT